MPSPDLPRVSRLHGERRSASRLRWAGYSHAVSLHGFPIRQAIVQVAHVRDPLLPFAPWVVPITLLAMFFRHEVEPTPRRRCSSAGEVAIESAPDG